MHFRAAQVEVLSAAAAGRFEEEVLGDLRASFPDLFASRGDEAARALVHEARTRAEGHGFGSQAQVAQYIGLADPDLRIARLSAGARAHLRGLVMGKAGR